MKVTCLRCGKQFQHQLSDKHTIVCECGADINVPVIHDTGIRPNLRSAERSRYRAFLAAGIVSNTGIIAFIVALFGFLVPALGAIAAIIGIYVLATKRGPIAKWSGRRYAWVAIILGVCQVIVGSYLFSDWYARQRSLRMTKLQNDAQKDLKALLQAQRSFYANNDRYGQLGELRFKPPRGSYTLYLGPDQSMRIGPKPDGLKESPLPDGIEVALSEQAFTAAAVGNIDGDDQLDIWTINHHNQLVHLQDDNDTHKHKAVSSAPTSSGSDSDSDASSEGDATSDTRNAAQPDATDIVNDTTPIR